MSQITNEHLLFLQEAKDVFKIEPFRETHRNCDETLIALRQGLDRDCIQIFELGPEVALFAQQIPPVILKKEVIKDEN